MKADYLANSARSIGVLLHPTALPNSPVCGTFGYPAKQWLQTLASNDIGVWQFLPLAPTDATASPYSSPSGFALNPWFLDSYDLAEQGFFPSGRIKDLPGEHETNLSFVDFEIADQRSATLGKFLRMSWEDQDRSRHDDFQSWCRRQFWLEDHIMFMEIRKQYKGVAWWQWPEPLAAHRKISLEKWKETNYLTLLEQSLLQWHLDRQWQSIKQLARDIGVLLFGDLPFYVSHDSADVWSNRSLFSVQKDGTLNMQSGVPPDYFSEKGQLWGTPVYQWDRHRETDFSWWRRRLKHHLAQVDILRLDHFRALEAFWAVPGDKLTAEEGSWFPSPGVDLLELFKKDCGGKLPLVAEDLGLINQEVEDLRDQFQLPGMKILQFAFNGDETNPYLPENIQGDCWVVYTGTHDNQTTLGWWEDLAFDQRECIRKRFRESNENPIWQLIDIGLSTEASLFISPLQDLLCLDNNARFNTPGTTEGNWNWRISNANLPMVKALRDYGDRGAFWGRSFRGVFDSLIS